MLSDNNDNRDDSKKNKIWSDKEMKEKINTNDFVILFFRRLL